MKNELNYLSEKIEELEQECCYYEREVTISENEVHSAELNEIWTRKTTELELLTNIINVVTEHALN